MNEDQASDRHVFREGDRVVHDSEGVKGTVETSTFGKLEIEWDDDVTTRESFHTVSFVTDGRGNVVKESDERTIPTYWDLVEALREAVNAEEKDDLDEAKQTLADADAIPAEVGNVARKAMTEAMEEYNNE